MTSTPRPAIKDDGSEQNHIPFTVIAWAGVDTVALILSTKAVQLSDYTSDAYNISIDMDTHLG